MATFNGAEHLPAQLQSLLRQSRLPDEMVIGDDASTDGTRDLLRYFAESAPFSVRLIEHPERLGYRRNFVETAELATGDLLFFCDQDDLWDAEKLSVVAQAAETTSALAYSHDLEVFFEGTKAGLRPIPSYFGHLRGLALPADLCCKGCGLAVHRDFIQRFGWPPETSSLTHDAWVALLTTALGARDLIDAQLVRHRIHGRNASGWLISAQEKRQNARRRSKTTFASMLDFYIKDENRDWMPMLMEALGAQDTLADFASAAAARDLLAARMRE